MVVFVYGFIGWSALVSVSKWNTVRPDYTYVGLDNFRNLFDNFRFLLDIRNTVVFTVFFVAACLVIAALIAIRQGGEMALAAIFPRGMTTHSMATLFEMFGARLLWNFVALYLLAVNMRLLGLLYVAKKRKLGWFER